MRTEEEIKVELERRKNEILGYFLGATSKNDMGGNVSLSRRKDIINTLRWVLKEVQKIEVSHRGSAGLSKK